MFGREVGGGGRELELHLPYLYACWLKIQHGKKLPENVLPLCHEILTKVM